MDELLIAKSKYQSETFFEQPSEYLIELFDSAISNMIDEVTFDDLFMQSNYWGEIPNELLEPILKKNVPAIVNKFMESASFSSAKTNANLLIKIADSLSAKQWEYILEAFWTNNQIYASYDCPDIFCLLFKNSVKLSGFIQPYWLSFRENLNELHGNNISRLKQLIDSYQTIEEA